MLIKTIILFVEYNSDPCTVLKRRKNSAEKKISRQFLKNAFKQRWIWWTDRLGLIKNSKRTNPLIELGFSADEVHDKFGMYWYGYDYLDYYIKSFFNYYPDMEKPL